MRHRRWLVAVVVDIIALASTLSMSTLTAPQKLVSHLVASHQGGRITYYCAGSSVRHPVNGDWVIRGCVKCRLWLKPIVLVPPRRSRPEMALRCNGEFLLGRDTASTMSRHLFSTGIEVEISKKLYCGAVIHPQDRSRYLLRGSPYRVTHEYTESEAA
ncbi:hypothetical protein CYLTODRAFT_445540, partial [Cylindrobasidium torrendii FP15055 ss-10]